MPQVKGFIIYLVINTNGHIYASRQHSSLKSLSANLSVYIWASLPKDFRRSYQFQLFTIGNEVEEANKQ